MGDNAEHALISASGFPRTARCYGSVALGATQPNDTSKYAAEGSAAHALGAWLLGGRPKELESWGLATMEMSAHDFLGHVITADGMDFTVDQEMADAVQAYVDYCRSLGGIALVETKVNYANWLGVAEDLAWGTSDFIAIHTGPYEVIAIDEDGYLCGVDLPGARIGRLIMSDVDYKHGAGVAVSPRWNEQAMLYAGGALNEIDLFLTPKPDDIICIVIHQPRIGEGEPQEWYITVAELKNWLKIEAAMAAQHAVKLWQGTQDAYDTHRDEHPHLTLADHAQLVTRNDLTPGEKQCRFCNAKAICPALTGLVVDAVIPTGFIDLSQVTKEDVKADAAAMSRLTLAEKFALIPLIQETIAAWQEQTKGLLLTGEPVGELWLKKGRKGDRKWADVDAVLKRLVRYLGTARAVKPREPISPTAVEAMVKAKALSAKQWSELQKLITQSEGGATIALPGEKGEPYELPKPEAAFTPITEDDDADLSYLV